MARNLTINPEQTPQKAAIAAFGNRVVSLPAQRSLAKGCSLVLPVTVDTAAALAGMDLVISYARADLQCLRICPSRATAQFGFKTAQGPGYARISFSDALALPAGETELAWLVFTTASTVNVTNEYNPAPKVRINYAEMKGELGESFRWYGDITREDAEITILESGVCEGEPQCADFRVEPQEGEGEGVQEGEGEEAGEGEGEGEAVIVEGEGEGQVKTEGEGEPDAGDEEEGGCLSGCGCKGKLMDTPGKVLGDWLLVGTALLVLGTLKHRGIKI